MAMAPSSASPSPSAAAVAHVEFGHLLLVSFLAVLKVLACAACGLLCARAGILNDAVVRGLSRLTYWLLLPLLLFEKLARAVTPSAVVDLWPLLVFPFVYIAMAAALNELNALLHRAVRRCWAWGTSSPAERADAVADEPPPKPHTKTVLRCALAFNNAFSLPYVVVVSIAHSVLGDEAATAAGAYVGLYSAVMSILMWLVGLEMMMRAAPPRTPEAIAAAAAAAAEAKRARRTFSQRARWLAKLLVAKRVFTTANLAIVLGLVGGLVPAVGATIFGGADAPLAFLAEFVELMGAAVVPVTLLLMGAKLAKLPLLSGGGGGGGGGACNAGCLCWWRRRRDGRRRLAAVAARTDGGDGGDGGGDAAVSLRNGAAKHNGKASAAAATTTATANGSDNDSGETDGDDDSEHDAVTLLDEAERGGGGGAAAPPARIRVTPVEVALAALGKLVVLPALALPIIVALHRAGVVDTTVALVLGVEATSPLANNMVVLAELAAHSQVDVSLLQLVQYACTPVTITAFAALLLTLTAA